MGEREKRGGLKKTAIPGGKGGAESPIASGSRMTSFPYPRTRIYVDASSTSIALTRTLHIISHPAVLDEVRMKD